MLKQIYKFLINWLICSLLCCSTLCYGSISDEQVKESTKKLDKIIVEAMEKLNIPGAAYTVVRGDKIIKKACFGSTLFTQKSPVTEDTLFPISSLTKNFTAILVGILVDEGKISFDDKVRKYLPDFFVGSEEISKEFTIRDLISMRSGFKHFSAESLFSANYPRRKIIDALKYVKQNPGGFRKDYGYQNIIFGIVGDVLEKATGERYEDLVQKYIFDKMGMTESAAIALEYETSMLGYLKYRVSRFNHDCEKLGFFNATIEFFKSIANHKNKKIVTSYLRDGEGLCPAAQIGYFNKFPATSGISLSVDDLAKWMSMLSCKGMYNGTQIVSNKTFTELTSKMVDITNLKDEDQTFAKERMAKEHRAYCMGHFTCLYGDLGKNERPIFFHMGGVYGANAYFALSFGDNLSIGVVCNLGGTANSLFPQYMTFQFLDLCFNFAKVDWVQHELTNRADVSKKQAEFHDKLKDSNLAPMEPSENYVGTYTCDMYGDFDVILENNELFLSNGIKKAKLKHVNRDIFEFPSNEMYFNYYNNTKHYAFFNKDESGKIGALHITCFDEGKSIFTRKPKKK